MKLGLEAQAAVSLVPRYDKHALFVLLTQRFRVALMSIRKAVTVRIRK